MLSRLSLALSRHAERFVPDPFVLALLLALAAFGLSLAHTGFDVAATLLALYDGPGRGRGFWNLLAFAMQMALILVTGHALASSPPVRRFLDAVVDRARTPRRATALVALVAMTLALVNWGLGLVAGALLARQVGVRARERGVAVHYPLLAAAGYSGMLVWHGGLSGSAPLKVTLASDLREILGEATAAVIGPLPLSLTVGSWQNLAGNAALLALVPALLMGMLPRDESARRAASASLLGAPDAELDAPVATNAEEVRPFAARLESSRVLALAVFAVGAGTLYLVGRRQGLAQLDPNLINFAFLFLGLLLHGSPRAYARAVASAVPGTAGILLQFPFYAGIMGLLTGTGLLASVAGALASVGQAWLPALSFYAAGLLNLFVPSGGGQWAVQGPVLMEAALRTGVAPERLVMALAYGDQWTNMLQPFWALPLLAITRVPARSIVGYTAVLLLASQAIFLAMLYVGW